MSERYQREIEEILQQVGEATPTKEPRKAERNSLLAPLSHIGRAIGNIVYVSSRQIMTIGLILLLAAILASILFPGLLGPIVWLGLIVFILVYVLFFSRPSVNAEQRWRGRPVGPQSSARRGDSSWYRFRRWLKR